MRDVEWQQADSFYNDLVGTARPRRARRPAAPPAPMPPVPPPGTGFADPARLFDNIVYRGMEATSLLESESEEEGGAWEAVALPGSSTPPDQLPRHAIVVRRALGEGRLASLQVLGRDVERPALYAADGRIRPDVLVIVRRTPLGQRPRTVVITTEEEGATTEQIEQIEQEDEFVEQEDLSAEQEDVAIEQEDSDLSFLRWSPATRAGRFPPRDKSAIGGRAFMEKIKGEGAPADWNKRENAIVAELSSGNMPDGLLKWIKINISYTGKGGPLTGTFEVLPDYLMVGSNDDYVHVPLDQVSAQLVADRFDAVLPTAKMCHAIYLQTAMKNRIGSIERDYYLKDDQRKIAKRGRAQTSTAAYLEHTEAIQARLKSAGITLGDLVAGHKKDVVIAKRLFDNTDRIAFHGFYDAAGYPHEPCYEGVPNPPQSSCNKETPTLAHNRRFSDYSQGVRLVHPSMIVNGERKMVADVLKDPVQSLLLSTEGPIVPARIPQTVKPRNPMESDEAIEDAEDNEYTEDTEDTEGEVIEIVSGQGFEDARPLEDVRAVEDVGTFEDTRGFEDSEVVVNHEDVETIGSIESDQDDTGEDVPMRGRGSFRHDPLGGDPGDNVEARWNVNSTATAASTIDIVVHLHGYGEPRTDFIAHKATVAGVDLLDTGGAVRVRSSQPTLVLVPRGHNAGGSRWVFDRLNTAQELDQLIAAGLTWFATTGLRLASGSTLTRGRLTLMAHSGGGAGLSALLDNSVNPNEVVCFDSMYGGEGPIQRWAEARIASPQAAQSGLRAFYTGCSGPVAGSPGGRWRTMPDGKVIYEPPGSWNWWTSDRRWHLVTTEVSARRLHEAVARALSRSTSGTALASRYKVERTSVAHNDIPARYTPALLNDIAATLPNAAAPPPATSRPACVANNDWLTNPPQKGGSEDPPPPRPA